MVQLPHGAFDAQGHLQGQLSCSVKPLPKQELVHSNAGDAQQLAIAGMPGSCATWWSSPMANSGRPVRVRAAEECDWIKAGEMSCWRCVTGGHRWDPQDLARRGACRPSRIIVLRPVTPVRVMRASSGFMRRPGTAQQHTVIVVIKTNAALVQLAHGAFIAQGPCTGSCHAWSK
jgi:hypothetical protein